MRSTLTATVDDRGRILLPRVVRRELLLEPGDEVLLDPAPLYRAANVSRYILRKVEVSSSG